MKYAVQFYNGTKMIEDTKPIEKEEAFKLFNDCLEKVKDMVKRDFYDEPVLCIWEDVGDGEYPVYTKELVIVDHRDGLKLDSRDNLYYETKVFVRPFNPQ